MNQQDNGVPNDFLPVKKFVLSFNDSSSPLVYGPIWVAGESSWLIELHLPSGDLILRRITGSSSSHSETLHFVLTDFNRPKICESSFSFSTEIEEVSIGHVDARQAPWLFFFEIRVRPENFLGGLPTDVRFIVLDSDKGTKLAEFAVHRTVISNHSPVFSAMFHPESEFVEAKTGVLTVKHMLPETISDLLHFIYTQKNVVEKKTLVQTLEVLNAAEQYQIDGELKQHCDNRLSELVSLENAQEFAHFAALYRLPVVEARIAELLMAG